MSPVMRKSLKPTGKKGLAVYDKNGQQIVNATKMTTPVYPNESVPGWRG